MVAPLDRLEHALVDLVRLGNLSRVHDRLVGRARLRIERGAYVVLATIGDDGPLRLSAVAAVLGIDVSTASRHVTRLSELGLIERSVDEADHRAAQLTLTAPGREALEGLRAARHGALAEVLTDWDSTEIADLAAAIERLNGAFAERIAPDQGDER